MHLRRLLIGLHALKLAITISEALVLTEPCCSTYKHAVSGFGPQVPCQSDQDSDVLIIESVEGPLVSSAFDADSFLCTIHKSYNMSFDGSIVLIPRGNCNFATKVYNAESRGAAAVIVYDHAHGGSDRLIEMKYSDIEGVSISITIPSVFVAFSTGNTLLGILDNVTIGNRAPVVTLNGTDSLCLEKKWKFKHISFFISAFFILCGLVFVYLSVIICTRWRRKIRISAPQKSLTKQKVAPHERSAGGPVVGENTTDRYV
mmetsp:Transcript_6437/g.8174  ORF Transcript_6437/g.8174 Transcript_6437/m.8174 type:complete len:259 (+) Transcript_6437:1-777(+)